VKTFAKSLLGRLGYELRRKPVDNHTDASAEMARLLAGVERPVVFDVGAKVGNTVLRYRKLLPNATIHAFETCEATFQTLTERTAQLPNVTLHRCGLGATTGTMKFNVNRSPSTSSILDASEEVTSISGARKFERVEQVEVPIQSLDDALRDTGVDRVDLLKLDVQGAEPQVIAGGARSLSERRVRMIFAEMIVSPFYKGQLPLHEVLALLDRHGYVVYGFYDLSAFAGPLRQFDALFVRKEDRLQLR